MTYGELEADLRDILEETMRHKVNEEVPFWAAAWLVKLVMDIRGLDAERSMD
jgi:hypothetical protein